MTSDIWLVTCDAWRMTHDTWHMTQDRLGEVDFLSKFQLPSSNSLGVKVFFKMTCDIGNMTCDMWLVRHDMWHMTHDMGQVGWGGHSVKISSPQFKQFGCEGVLKMTCDTNNTCHVTGWGMWIFCRNFSSLALTVWRWRGFEEVGQICPPPSPGPVVNVILEVRSE